MPIVRLFSFASTLCTSFYYFFPKRAIICSVRNLPQIYLDSSIAVRQSYGFSLSFFVDRSMEWPTFNFMSKGGIRLFPLPAQHGGFVYRVIKTRDLCQKREFYTPCTDSDNTSCSPWVSWCPVELYRLFQGQL